MVQKPAAILNYKSGVDRVDQMLSYYPTIRRTIKWFKKLFWWYLMLPIQNSKVIHNHKRRARGEKNVNLFKFQKELISFLCNQIDHNINIVVEEERMSEGEEDREGELSDDHSHKSPRAARRIP